MRTASIGALAMMFAGSLFAAAGWKSAGLAGDIWPQIGVALAVIALLTWLNFVGVVWGGRVQNLTTLIKAGGVAAVAITPFVLLPWNHDAVQWSNYSSRLPAETTPAEPFLAQYAVILLAIMWAYDGWHHITPVAEEIHDPQRNVPKALFIGIGIIIALYVSANIAYYGVLSMSELAAADKDGAFAAAVRLLGSTGGAAITAIILCSTFGAINSNLHVFAARGFCHGPRPRVLRRPGPRARQLPHPVGGDRGARLMSMALVVVAGLLKLALADVDPEMVSNQWLAKMLETIQTDSIFELLTNFVIFAASIFYVLCVVAVLVLRWRQPDWRGRIAPGAIP